MKHILLLSLTVLFYTVRVCAQADSSGIFRTAKDFLNGKLDFAIRCDSQSHKINADPLFKRNQVIVKHNGQTYKLAKDSVYAVRYCSGAVERLSSGQGLSDGQSGRSYFDLQSHHPCNRKNTCSNKMVFQ